MSKILGVDSPSHQRVGPH